MIRRLGASALFALLLLALPARAASDPRVPAWMKSDPAAKHVTLDIVAGFDANNGALNFNGYYTGDMTVVVPVGWTVDIHFRNNDAMLPHSLLVTKPFPLHHLPDHAGVEDVAIPRAYTDSPDQGIPSPKTDTVTSGDPTTVSGVSVSDPNLAAGDMVTVTVKEGTDDSGLLSIAGGGVGVAGNGTRKLVITGTEDEVNADLANLTYQGGSTDGAASISATLTVKTDDANGQSHANIAMTVEQAQPAITAPSTDTVTIGQSTPITGVSVTDTEVPSDAIITMTLTDIHGLLYATQPGGGTVSGSGTKDLVLTGTVAQVDAHLASLAYVGKADGTDVITASVSDGTNSTTAQIHMTVQALATFGANLSGTTGGSGLSGGTQGDTPTLTSNPMAA